MIRACVAGVGGKMGSRILNALRAEEDFVVTGAFEKAAGGEFTSNAGAATAAPNVSPRFDPGRVPTGTTNQLAAVRPTSANIAAHPAR